jgi:dihydrodipicolinate synthase/N-acetylneuraminate lyase
MEHNVKINMLVLTGKEALVVPGLAAIGAVTVLGITINSAYKLGLKVAEKIDSMKCSNEAKES